MRNEWTDTHSEHFLNMADIITPSRQEQMNLLASLIPAQTEDDFQIVELGCGGGDLASVILDRIPSAHYLGLDGSAVMLETAAERNRRFGERAKFEPFDLASDEWRTKFPGPVHAFVSSLLVHHLPDDGKRTLYKDLYEALSPGGAMLLIDVVMPHHPMAKRAVGAQWDDVVHEQSHAHTGSTDTFAHFKHDGWNCYSHTDPMDRPASLFDQLRWISEVGFSAVDCFWQRAGHALFGGYKE